jgi:murein L,D-transpeptidase YafK
MLVLGAAPGAEARSKRWLLRNNRVKQAFKTKRATLKAAFKRQGLSYPARRVFIRIFKRERVLELWGSDHKGRYKLVKRYPVCAASGELGPKRRQGDHQVPEGFYRVRVFNPWSAFHLSMGINYPNRSDRILGARGNLGGAIMLHGDCVSIGCVAITDDLIKEVYLAAAESFLKGRRPIPVHIFPTRMSERGMRLLKKRYSHKPKLLSFWKNIKPGYDYFEKRRTLPRVKVNRKGKYLVSAPGNKVALR